MYQSFYASGFLYNSKTKQILLIQSEPTENLTNFWSMPGGRSSEGEDAQATFQRVISKLLNLNIKSKNIYPVYDYFNQAMDKTTYVFYAEVARTLKFSHLTENSSSWLTFSQTLKMLLSTDTKRDLVVAERVINLKQRIDQNLQ